MLKIRENDTQITQLTGSMLGRYGADTESIGMVSAQCRPSKLRYLGSDGHRDLYTFNRDFPESHFQGNYRVTEDLIRKRAEHNECEISTLEEISLHQQDIERIEHLDKWCRELKILYLQSNLIPRIEHVGRLKKLQYINLALNNVERIENLDGCESLQKLDLTVNFVGELTSIQCLLKLVHFRELFLTGNPCTEYDGYRNYVIATLKQLQTLDGIGIEKSERIQALQNYDELKAGILNQQKTYQKTRARQKDDARIRKERSEKQSQPGFDGRWYTDMNKDVSQKTGKAGIHDEKTEQEIEKEFWDEKVPFSPESRLDVHQHMQEQRNKDNKKDEKEPPKPRRMFTEDGRPLNVNEAKLDFSLTDDEENNTWVLDVACFRYLDTSLIDVDVQTNYVRAVIKGKLFQLCLTQEVQPDSSSAQRSQTTGHLLITMPKANEHVKPKPTKSQETCIKSKEENSCSKNINHLEVDPSLSRGVDFGNIVQQDTMQKCVVPLGSNRLCRANMERANSSDFVDDLDVPPLE